MSLNFNPIYIPFALLLIAFVIVIVGEAKDRGVFNPAGHTRKGVIS